VGKKPPTWRVLAIDDDRIFLEIVHLSLTRSGCEVKVASDPRVGLNEALTGAYDLVLLDLMMPGLDGEEILTLLKPLSPHQKVVVVSGSDSKDVQARVRNLGAAAYIKKPVNTRALYGIPLDILQDRVRSNATAIPLRQLSILGQVGAFVFDDDDPGEGKRIAAVAILVALSGILYTLFVI
jgi:DNA-binding response OmpR family regulator